MPGKYILLPGVLISACPLLRGFSKINKQSIKTSAE